MPLETSVTYISDLVSTNPTSTDGLAQGDDHIRLVKSALQATFPSITGAVTATHTAVNAAAVATGATGVLNISAGAVGAPSYSFTGDTDTGFYHSAADEVSLALGGLQKYVFSATRLDLKTNELNLSAATKFLVGGSAVFPLQTANIGDTQVTTAKVADANITYAKIQNVAASKLLGNPTGSAAAPSEITVGAGLSLSGTTLTAPATPIRGLYTNKTIKVTSNTAVAITCDGVIVFDGTNYANVAVNNTLATNAGVGLDKLDSSTTISANQWLYIYAIYNGTTVKTVACASWVLPDLADAAFSGYTYWAYLGAIKTASASTNLMGTWQLGRRAQYIVGLAQTTAGQGLASGASGNPSTPTWTALAVGNFVPTTAVAIHGHAYMNNTGFAVAPNNSYGGTSSSSNSPPVAYTTSSAVSVNASFSFILESTNIYYASNGTGTVFCDGWDDPI